MNNFYNRLSQLSEIKGFKSINKFALDGLNYLSSEKLNRLKKENTNPSVEILIDISNKFEDVNIEWLLTGRGEMLRSVAEKNIEINPTDKKLIASLEKNVAMLEENLKQCREQNKSLIENRKLDV